MTALTAFLMLGKVTIVLAIGLAAVRIARRSRAAVRHLVLAATFAVALVLPLASAVAPPIDIGLPVRPAAASSLPPVAIDEITQTTPNQDGPSMSQAATPPASPHAVSRWWWLTLVWAVGAALVLAPLLAGLVQMRSLRRSGVPWSRGRSLARALVSAAGTRSLPKLLVHGALRGPLTFGVFRPAIVLPADATSWDEADLQRAIVHELEHVRRRDWVCQCAARVVCACYWFHPLVWTAWRRLIVEAERACDDAVLARSEATEYADQLVMLASHLSSRRPLLAMANRKDLSTRVTAVLDPGQERGRAGHTWVIVACAAAALTLVVLSPLRLVAFTNVAQATTANPQKLRYDVASIKPCEAEAVPTGARGTAGGTNATFSPGRFRVPCVTTEQLIYLAYAAAGARDDERLINDNPGSASNSTKVRGGPDWVHSLKEKYQIEATAEGATERTVLMGAMLRTLLEERFKLRLHRETEQVDMLELKVGDGGLKLTPMKEGDCEPIPDDGPRMDLTAAKPLCGSLNMMNSGGRIRWTFGAMGLDVLAGRLSGQIKMHVIDRTGVKDKFVFRLEFQQDGSTPATSAARSEQTPPTIAVLPDGGQPAPSLTAALAALGLELEKVKAPRGYLVIDHIERPTPDGPLSTPPARAAGAGRLPR